MITAIEAMKYLKDKYGEENFRNCDILEIYDTICKYKFMKNAISMYLVVSNDHKYEEWISGLTPKAYPNKYRANKKIDVIAGNELDKIKSQI